ALGMERLVALLSDKAVSAEAPVLDAYVVSIGKEPVRKGLVIAERLRMKGFRTEVSYGSSSLKNQMRRADKLGARYVIIIGEDELREGMLSYKRMSDGASGKVSASEAEGLLSTDKNN
ncbi:MAG: hypothetical protein KAR83_04320, partial [Thermodesulfovibrionales bacterium]|nr:hypothetical protein [Thermodesulfovibrionales bacterium]